MTGRPHFGQIRSVASSVTSDFFTLFVFSSTSLLNGSKKSRTTGTHSPSPAAIRSRSSSMRTVKPVSTISGKCSCRKSVTTKPTSSGNKALPSLRTYFRSTSVEIVGAYVDGRPIPNSSSVLTSDASVKRGGGCVKCCDASSPSSFSASPGWTSGSGAISFSGSSLDSKYARRNPSKRTRRPLARVRGPEFLRDDLTRLVERALGHVKRVGTHIGDETDRCAVADGDAFIELLREDHRPLHGISELARCLLLDGRGRERRSRVA